LAVIAYPGYFVVFMSPVIDWCEKWKLGYGTVLEKIGQRNGGSRQMRGYSNFWPLKIPHNCKILDIIMQQKPK